MMTPVPHPRKEARMKVGSMVTLNHPGLPAPWTGRVLKASETHGNRKGLVKCATNGESSVYTDVCWWKLQHLIEGIRP